MKNPSRILLLLLFFASSCAVSKNFTPATRYAPEALQQDFAVFQQILENEHPGIYWFTPKDSMDFYFRQGKSMLRDSLTEYEFRNVLSYIIAQIHCGHTSVRPSRRYLRSADSLRPRPLPLSIKIWPDTAVVTANANRRDSLLMRGAVLTAIDGVPVTRIVDTLFQYLPSDGYNLTHKYQTLSNRGVFATMYPAIFGYKKNYEVSFIDTAGHNRTAAISQLAFTRDTSGRFRQPLPPQPSRRDRRRMMLSGSRLLRIDSASRIAFMDLNSFTRDARLRTFFRRSFRRLEEHDIQHLVIDLRGNGGGSVTNSNLLTKYIATQPFRIADSLYAVARKSQYGRYQQYRLWNSLFLHLMTRKMADNYYHFRYFEKKYFRPKRKNHFDGQVYILTGGNTFSASTLFIQSIRRQPNVVVVGEETGGGAYGNNAWLIPDVTLPVTGIRFRLPLFRLVIDKDAVKGRGVVPTVPSEPTVDAIRRNIDFKTEKVMELIRARQQNITSGAELK